VESEDERGFFGARQLRRRYKMSPHRHICLWLFLAETRSLDFVDDRKNSTILGPGDASAGDF
jgi:hypothetical protein